MICVDRYSSVTYLKGLWDTFFAGKSTLRADWQTACELEACMWAGKPTDYQVCVFWEDDRIFGILPLQLGGLYDEMWNDAFTWLGGDRFCIEPGDLEKFRALVPRPYLLVDNDVAYPKAGCPDWLYHFPGCAFRLPAERTMESYLASLTKKHRYNLRAVLKDNPDVWTAACHTPRDQVSALRAVTRTMWLERIAADEDCADIETLDYMWRTLDVLMEAARRQGRLVEIALYEGMTLLAVNYSVIEGHTVKDFLCYWNAAPEWRNRGLGNLAILRNIEHVMQAHPHVDTYDLLWLSAFSPYKRKFLNMETTFPVMALFPAGSDALIERCGVKPPYVHGDEVVR